MDKLAHTYTTKRATKRWPLVMFSNILDLATVAARCVWKIKYEGETLSTRDARSEFIQNISKQLMLPNIKRRLLQTNISRGLSTTIANSVEKIEIENEKSLTTSQSGTGLASSTRTTHIQQHS